MELNPVEQIVLSRKRKRGKTNKFRMAPTSNNKNTYAQKEKEKKQEIYKRKLMKISTTT